MPLEIIRNDITKVRADAIVNTANPHVAVGVGVDSAIYRAAGEQKLLAERAKIGELRPGQAAYTPAFDLNAKYIIHTVGPAWQGGSFGEVRTVAQCYKNSLAMAKELGCESIAFPLISSGTYGFPKDVALKTAVSEISGFLFSAEMTVYLVVYDRESFEISGKAFTDIRSYIGDADVKEPLPGYRAQRLARRRLLERMYSVSLDDGAEESLGEEFDLAPRTSGSVPAAPTPARSGPVAPLPSVSGPAASFLPDSVPAAPRAKAGPKASQSIDDAIKNRGETFQEHLFRIIDRRGLKDPDVYKKANLDRKHFSKIRGNVNYKPSKKTALALAVALELSLDETKDLLLTAGIALSKSSTFDIIIEYCISHGVHDIHEINCILFKYEQPILGA